MAQMIRMFDDDSVVDSRLDLTAAATLEIYQQMVHCDSTAGAFSVTLPNVSQAKGRVFVISLDTDNGNVTVQDQDEAFLWSDLVMTAANDFVCLMSNGEMWIVLNELTT